MFYCADKLEELLLCENLQKESYRTLLGIGKQVAIFVGNADKLGNIVIAWVLGLQLFTNYTNVKIVRNGKTIVYILKEVNSLNS